MGWACLCARNGRKEDTVIEWLVGTNRATRGKDKSESHLHIDGFLNSPGSELPDSIHSRRTYDRRGRGVNPPGRQDLAQGTGWTRRLSGNSKVPTDSRSLVECSWMTYEASSGQTGVPP